MIHRSYYTYLNTVTVQYSPLEHITVLPVHGTETNDHKLNLIGICEEETGHTSRNKIQLTT
jgi:hypothetical protein